MDTVADVVRQIRSQVQNEPENGDKDSDANSLRSRLKTAWHKVREAIEAAANDPDIHGQTRNRYNRIPRYNYVDLIDSLNIDGNGGQNTNTFYSANELWQTHKTGKTKLSEDDVKKMELLAKGIKTQH